MKTCPNCHNSIAPLAYDGGCPHCRTKLSFHEGHARLIVLSVFVLAIWMAQAGHLYLSMGLFLLFVLIGKFETVFFAWLLPLKVAKD